MEINYLHSLCIFIETYIAATSTIIRAMHSASEMYFEIKTALYCYREI